jgi:hypothetical protein
MATNPAPTPLALLHRTAGVIAVVLIAGFQLSTLATEALGDEAAIRMVKEAIVWGLLLMVPALMAVGASGFRLARGRRGGLLDRKLRRMPLIAGNGILVLIPAALFLASKARAGEYDAAFYTVQVIELATGGMNLWLLALNIRDGLKLTAGRRRAARA